MSRNLRRQGNRFDHQVAAAVVTVLSTWDSEMKRRNRWLIKSQDQSWSRVQKGAKRFSCNFIRTTSLGTRRNDKTQGVVFPGTKATFRRACQFLQCSPP